jgi:hypothetical protein
MKQTTIIALSILALPFTSLADPGSCKGCKNCEKSSCLVSPDIPKDTPAPGKITKAQREELRLLQEEERLAYDIYNKLGEKYPLNPFKNIPHSEANHMEATASLLEYHGIPKPGETEPGKYESPVLQKLYDKLVKRGQKTEIDALRVGALVEETDIRDLRLMAQNPPSQVAAELSRKLEIASYNHLRAFVRNLGARGVDYQPVLLKPRDFDRIISGEELDNPAGKSEANADSATKRKGKGKRQHRRNQAGRGRDRS